MKSSQVGGLAGFRSTFINDFISGFIVFLLALPLSVGIALASGAPPTAGILAAIVGGMLGSWLGGSYLTIHGPAAGLIVIVLGAITDLGGGNGILGYKRTLAAIVVAGLLQIVMAFLRLGALGVGVPGSVIHGMLTAIGVIIMAKQFSVALGVPPAAKEVLEIIARVPESIQHMNTEVALIAAISFMIIIGYKTFKGKWALYIPAPLVVVIAGIYFGKLFDFDHSHLVTSHWQQFEIGPKMLLTLPQNLASAIVFPDFSHVFSLASLRWSVSLALVASIESLLTANAVERMDPKGRTADLDRELLGNGICNTLCGLVGALPIIAEIVRSTANVKNSAQTPKANFFHGTFILLFLILFPDILHEIPLAALAAILISVGYALAHPSQLMHTAKVGKDHLAAYLTTLLVTLYSDLLIGVACGIAVEVLFNLLHGASVGSLFKLTMEEKTQDQRLTLRVQSSLLFTNYLRLKRRIETSDSAELVLDLSEAPVVDHTSLDHLHRFKNEFREGGKELILAFSEEQLPVSRHPLAARRRPRRTRVEV